MNIVLKQDKSTQALVYANLLPLFGVLFLHWTVIDILYTYWLETLIIGVITVMKMLKTKMIALDESSKNMPFTQKTSAAIIRTFLVGFFIFHYGGFLSGYFFFIFGVFPAIFRLFDHVGSYNISALGIFISAAGLFASHWISYKQNFIGKNESKKTNIMYTMFAPYKRIIVLHLTIILGMFSVILATVGIPKILSSLNYDSAKLIPTVLNSVVLGLFIWLKIVIDKKYHLREHFELELKQTL
ncbi:MAG: hypothetical protein A2921_04745 [Candidatus Magasanikbacteria bacterium RIFCSPLOWO2_01_FULL_43_20b]|uniref:Uncharacterized protein n=1 Tax=Candidatus Magasanikbacteria bacterium RIFCSPLOWO2_12_FULL_43_12 TaxID=1798692 RepID=A0A1F6MRZ4_9BACT|nr:MAG: hypothetical protein A3C74_00470 [Candidatus Magasanikbacteria bacterium RIFCSPHIGHO2_02_FULL_44_13]OGH71768.1 MAG: hypothetical protein A3I93_01690 [Candidatus Magasanikbacteria bacterium RIFCSPLOWO2_02_FULL_43_22]OGH73091.1 MAG: hypothetical protein A2921_04745 [Candidatus Magasanikbacteria bacterium RIFCSPLOWO2_01_FULL_43_20b]OGH74411.1 MAG: hypothetical protein A3G00_00950 [Candidatus Magasanikbacteria bacterium RIFCSPLOWO2_12_FULL_43_12]